MTASSWLLVALPGLGALAARPVELLGHGPLEATASTDELVLSWPSTAPDGPAHAVRIGLRSPVERWQSGRSQSP